MSAWALPLCHYSCWVSRKEAGGQAAPPTLLAGAPALADRWCAAMGGVDGCGSHHPKIALKIPAPCGTALDFLPLSVGRIREYDEIILYG